MGWWHGRGRLVRGRLVTGGAGAGHGRMVARRGGLGSHDR
jgi:hypothetical protein